MGDDNIDIDAKKILNDLYACRVVPISGGISDAANLTTSNIREPKERPEPKYPKVFCYTCGNELHSEVYNMTWEDAIEMRHSCCCKEEKFVVYNEIIWNDKMPEVWTAFITDNPKIG